VSSINTAADENAGEKPFRTRMTLGRMRRLMSRRVKTED